MKRKRTVFSSFALLIIDLLIVVLSYIASYYIGKGIGRPYTRVNLVSVYYIIPVAVAVFTVLFYTYALDDIYDTLKSHLLGVIFTATWVYIIVLAVSYVFRLLYVPRVLTTVAFIIQIILLPAVNSMVQSAYRKNIKALSVCVVTNRKKMLYRYFSGIAWIKPFYFNCSEFGNSNKCDIVVVDEKSVRNNSFVNKLIYETDKPLYIIPREYSFFTSRTNVVIIGNITLIPINKGLSKFDIFLKRALDIAVALVALVVFSPVFLVAYIMIVKEDGHPVFYLQERMGCKGKPFKIIKFRTMIKDAEKKTGAVRATDNDPRITRAGKFLRKSGLDEVPQFINVLKGEMSVVGPRPERPELHRKIEKSIPYYLRLMVVKPGITGFSQVYGKYDMSFKDRLQMDLAYINSPHIVLTDVFVIFNTLKVFFFTGKRK
jgi:lipopolysaccharide/colanic/teichoic acid biosynthesis glycosyltransferase